MRAARIEIFKDRAGWWRWRQRAANGKITETAEAYASRSNARRAAKRRAATMSTPCEVVTV